MDIKHIFDDIQDDVETLGKKSKKQKPISEYFGQKKITEMLPVAKKVSGMKKAIEDIKPDEGVITSPEPAQQPEVRQTTDDSTYMEKKPEETIARDNSPKKPILVEEPINLDPIQEIIDPLNQTANPITNPEAIQPSQDPQIITQQQDQVINEIKNLQEAEGIGQKISSIAQQTAMSVGGLGSALLTFASGNPALIATGLITAGALPIVVPAAAIGIKKVVDYFEGVPEKMEQVKQDIDKLKQMKQQIEQKSNEIKSKF